MTISLLTTRFNDGRFMRMSLIILGSIATGFVKMNLMMFDLMRFDVMTSGDSLLTISLMMSLMITLKIKVLTFKKL